MAIETHNKRFTRYGWMRGELDESHETIIRRLVYSMQIGIDKSEILPRLKVRVDDILIKEHKEVTFAVILSNETSESGTAAVVP